MINLLIKSLFYELIDILGIASIRIIVKKNTAYKSNNLLNVLAYTCILIFISYNFDIRIPLNAS